MTLQIVPVLYPRKEELKEPIVADFMKMDEFRYYVEDGEVMYYFHCAGRMFFSNTNMQDVS